MMWFTFSSSALFLLMQLGGIHAAAVSPWSYPAKAQRFMTCLTNQISTSAVFPQQEEEDMKAIVETMMSSISNANYFSKAQQQAFSVAFASSMAELIIAEDHGNDAAVLQKTNVLVQALQSCFRSTFGSVNRHFISEMKDLIRVFARKAQSQQDNELDIGVLNYGFGGLSLGSHASSEDGASGFWSSSSATKNFGLYSSDASISSGSTGKQLAQNLAGAPSQGGSLHWTSKSAGLTSLQATARIRQITSQLASSIKSGSLDLKAVMDAIISSNRQAKSAGLAEKDAHIEALLEMVAAMFQTLSSNPAGFIDISQTESIASSFVRNLSGEL